ncbi:MAG TPA: hypothetical protein VEI95_00355 [Acidobacteriota bacterium]|nr:hypothetical protein [Acidobacteriota bacterium]
MKRNLLAASMATLYVFSAAWVFAQAFGDYGRTLGGIPHGGISAPRAPGSVNQGSSNSGGVGDVGGRGLPSRLVVAAKTAGLYPRQDDEAEKMDQLSQGEMLVPMVQSSGGNDWFMVKTTKGVIGWIKAADVRAESVKK